MSHKLISLNRDLAQLKDAGYEVEIRAAYLALHHIPYVNSKREIKYGILVCPLDMAGDRTIRPATHVVHFSGEFPCNKNGEPLPGIRHASNKEIKEGIEVHHSFSNKPKAGFADFFEKMTSYERIISGHAESVDPSVTAKTFRVIEPTLDESVFNYLDTNSSRAEISHIAAKLAGLKIAIVGLGGTGAYVLDLVAKTPVAQIHIYDADDFGSHNAFRSPGAIGIDVLRTRPLKVSQHKEIYSKMHRHITPHECNLDASNINDISGMDFVFVCVDNGSAKKVIVDALVEKSIPFVDVGIGVNVLDAELSGSVRVTAVTRDKNDHISRRISFADVVDNAYERNIQIAELNSLNAALAVIKWKKLFGFYRDLEKEHSVTFDIDQNKIFNDETNNA